VALGGFGSVFGAFAGGIIVGLVEASTALILPPSLKSVGIYASICWWSSSGRAACSGRCDGHELCPAPPPRFDRGSLSCGDRRDGAAVRERRLRPEHHGSDADVCGAVAELEYLGGYCGQISLGHALYFGLGAYTTALLFTKFGVLPWFGMLGGGLISALIAMALGYPCFRLRGHYFVIATIVIAETALLLFQNWDWAGAPRSASIFPCVATAG